MRCVRERYVASLFRGGQGVLRLHTLAISMKNETSPDDLEEYPKVLFHVIHRSYPEWLGTRVAQLANGKVPAAEIGNTVHQCLRTLDSQLLDLLATDVDAQRSNPLHVIRLSTVGANTLLQTYEVETPLRDQFEIEAMPHDIYAIGPLTWKDLGDEVHDAGIAWGAWKAATVLTRRRNEGKLQ